MPRDYARSPKNKHKASLPGWVWMAGGLFIGLFVALLVFLDRSTPAGDGSRIGDAVSQLFDKTTQKVHEAQKRPTAAAPTKPAAEKNRPRFDFYTILPELEVAIPEEELVKASKNPTQQATPTKAGSYMVQVGSFRNPQQADRLKAKLALQGIEANIQTVRIKEGETWHRVRVGPISNINTLNRTRKRLNHIGVSSIVVKNKG